MRSHGESVRIKWVCLEVVYSKAVLEPSLLLLSFIKLSFSGIYPICIYISHFHTLPNEKQRCTVRRLFFMRTEVAPNRFIAQSQTFLWKVWPGPSLILTGFIQDQNVLKCYGLVAKDATLAKTASKIAWNRCEFYAYCIIKFKRHRIPRRLCGERDICRRHPKAKASLRGVAWMPLQMWFLDHQVLSTPRSIRKSLFLLEIWVKQTKSALSYYLAQIWQKNDDGTENNGGKKRDVVCIDMGSCTLQILSQRQHDV